jgi:hypothetical protein
MDGLKDTVKTRKVKLEWMVLVLASTVAILVKVGILKYIPW